MKRRAIITLLGAAALAAVAPAGAGAGELRIGLLTSLTGPLSVYGVPEKAAAEFAVNQLNEAGGINGNKVKLLVEDDTSKPVTFLNSLNRLIDQEKVHALVGPITSGMFRAGSSVVKEKKVVMISPTATAPDLTKGNPFAFRNNPAEDTNIPILLKRMARDHPQIKTISIIYDQKEAADKVIGEIYQREAPKVGWKILDVTTFLTGDLNFSDVVAKTLRGKPDVVAAAAHAEDAANVARELRRQGYTGRILGGTPTVSENYIKIAGGAAENTYVVVPYYHGAQTAANKKFLSAYTKASSRETPDPWEASTYEVVGMLAQAMAKADVTGDPARLEAERQAIRDQLEKLKDHPGLVGRINWAEERVATKEVVIIYVKDGQWRAL